MHMMPIGAPGAEKPVVRVDDTPSIDVPDLTPDLGERTQRQHLAGAR
ncbi:hypothetical protein GCM10009734_27170 [Nonomuraea bangladeshensis]